MARIAREHAAANFFHVMIQGNNKNNIFNTNELKIKYKQYIYEKRNDYDIKIIAYCIMDNHVHLLVHCQDIANMSNFMKSLNQSYSQYYNRINDRIGTIFRGRYKSENIMNQKYLENCINYIHANPVKAGIVREMNEYNFSSYNDYINKNGIIDDDILRLINLDVDNYYQKFYNICDENYNFLECIEYVSPDIVLNNYLKDKEIICEDIIKDKNI